MSSKTTYKSVACFFHKKWFSHSLWLSFFFLFSTIHVFSQTDITLRLQPVDQDSAFLSSLKIPLRTTATDTLTIIYCIHSAVQILLKAGYLTASVDSILMRDSTWTAFLYTGTAFRWANLRNGNIEPVWLEQIGFREKIYSGKPLNYLEIANIFEDLIVFAENHGFPFAAVRLDSMVINGDQISAALMLQKNRIIRFDDVQIKGPFKISPNYLQHYLGLKKESLYSKTKVLEISKRIKELPFLQEKQKTTITFKGERAFVNLFLEKKKASRFDFLVGVAPNSNLQIPGKVLITGTFNADFNNQFGVGERVFVEFRRLKPQTQRLDVRFSYPYILGLPFGIDTRLDIYKRDSTNLDATADFGLQYLLEGGNYLKVFWNSINSSLLRFNETIVIAQKKLPAVLDIKRNFFGLELLQRRLDYRWNPRRGWSAWLRGAAGTKRIQKNNAIVQLEDPFAPEFDFLTLYDSLVLNSTQLKFEARLDKFFPVGKQSTFRLGLQGGALIFNQPLLQNEQYRIGGNSTLRGFDEEVFFATRYAIATAEYRLLLEQNSFLYAFFDAGYIENITVDTNIADQPMGFGAGISFETSVGIFGLALAVGRQQGNDFDFRSVKTHLGYVSLF